MTTSTPVAAKIRRIDFSPDEFLVGVAGMKPEEIGAYWIACSLMYSRGGPIVDDEAWIARACGCSRRTWRTLKERLVTAGKLSVSDGLISNSRTVREIERAKNRLNASRTAAEQSANARRTAAENEALSNDYNEIPEAGAQFSIELSPTNNDQPPTIKLIGENHTVTPAVAGPPAAENVASVIFKQGVAWLQQSTGRSPESCRSLLGKWRKDFGDDAALIAALGAAQREGPINAVEWMEGAIRARTAPTYRPMGAAPWNG